MRCGKCYLFEKKGKQWNDAQYHCKKKGANLVTVTEESENSFLARYSRFYSDSDVSMWIGKIFILTFYNEIVMSLNTETIYAIYNRLSEIRILGVPSKVLNFHKQ